GQMIDAFTIVGLPLVREVGLTRYPGDVLSPVFSTGESSFELYWRLEHGEVHGAIVNLGDELPDAFDGRVVISIHDDKAAITWAKWSPSWREYGRDSSKKKMRFLEAPFSECAGPLITHPLGISAWNEAAQRATRRAVDASDAARKISMGRCALSWYIGVSERPKEPIDETETAALKAQWRQAIERYKSSRRN
ncbi:MAG TPA: hypothetical protein VK025_02945, partial [Steroidobacter sp.]|nr:hypothetical protein [Steroidobacter sp.]